jgi:hypothetical protein
MGFGRPPRKLAAARNARLAGHSRVERTGIEPVTSGLQSQIELGLESPWLVLAANFGASNEVASQD